MFKKTDINLSDGTITYLTTVTTFFLNANKTHLGLKLHFFGHKNDQKPLMTYIVLMGKFYIRYICSTIKCTNPSDTPGSVPHGKISTH